MTYLIYIFINNMGFHKEVDSLFHKSNIIVNNVILDKDELLQQIHELYDKSWNKKSKNLTDKIVLSK